MANNILNKEQLDTKENHDKNINDIEIDSNTDKKQENFTEVIVNTETIDNKSINSYSFEDKSSSDKEISFFRKYLLLILISIGILLFLTIFSTVFALINKNNSKIIKGISINGINVSGLTLDDAKQKLNNEFSKKLNSNINLVYQDYLTEFIPSQDIDANYDISVAVEKAYSIGRSGNLIKNNYEILVAKFANKNVFVNLDYNIEKLDSYINKISVELPDIVIQPSYYIENESLIIVNGTSGIELIQDKSKNLIISNIENLSSSNSINLPIQNVQPNKIDINKIHQEIYSEPQNAYVIQEPFELNVGSSGIDFAITIEEAQRLLSEEKEEYIIPLKITPPEIGVEDLGNEIFVHNLSTFSSTYKESNVNRSTNVKLASNKINNFILLPGEIFSYNKVVGERTFANGFKEASVYTSSGVVDGLGGGICQVSSTLYNSVLRANLEIVERKNHRYAVSYVPLGTDATVAYGSIDFRFKNNRKYPIKITASSVNGVCTVSIMGIKEETEYDVSITTKRLQTIPYQTKYIEDSSLPVGTQKQTQYGDNGYKYETYKTISLNGSVVSSILISTDNYTPLTRIVKVGTKQNEIITPPPTEVPVDNNNEILPDNPTFNDITGQDNNNNTSTESDVDNSTQNTPSTDIP